MVVWTLSRAESLSAVYTAENPMLISLHPDPFCPVQVRTEVFWTEWGERWGWAGENSHWVRLLPEIGLILNESLGVSLISSATVWEVLFRYMGGFCICFTRASHFANGVRRPPKESLMKHLCSGSGFTRSDQQRRTLLREHLEVLFLKPVTILE